MNVIALCSFYDESPAWLSGMAASLARCQITHLIAVDGAYLLMPDGRPRSGSEQHAALTETCHAAGLGLTLHTPNERWLADQTEKRTFMFTLGLAVAAGPQDWLLVIDADELLSDPFNLSAELRDADEDVAEVTLWSRYDPIIQHQALTRQDQAPVRRLFRAVDGLAVRGNHFTYMTGDGRYLWGDDRVVTLEPAADLRHVRIEHRNRLRDPERAEQQRRYYRLRDELGIEQDAFREQEAQRA